MRIPHLFLLSPFLLLPAARAGTWVDATATDLGAGEVCLLNDQCLSGICETVFVDNAYWTRACTEPPEDLVNLSGECAGGYATLNLYMETDFNAAANNALALYNQNPTSFGASLFLLDYPLGALEPYTVYDDTLCIDATDCYTFFFEDLGGYGLESGFLNLTLDDEVLLSILPGDRGDPIGSGLGNDGDVINIDGYNLGLGLGDRRAWSTSVGSCSLL